MNNRGRKIDSSSSGSDNFFQIPSVMKHTDNHKSNAKSNPKSKPKDKKSTSQSRLKSSKLAGRDEEKKLTKKMKEYEKQISELRQQLQDDQNNIKYFETFNQTQAEYDKLIQSYEETIQNFKKNEINLLEELQAQSQIAKEALNKLYQMQQEYNVERDKLKQYYEDYYRDKEMELQRKFDLQLQQLAISNGNNNYPEIENLQQKVKDMSEREMLYLEEIEIIKKKLNRNHPITKEKELRQKLIDMEMQLTEMENNISKNRQLETENQKLVLKVNEYEKKLHRKIEKEKTLRAEWNKQYYDLQTEIKYWKSEMDKVILENNLVLSKLTPAKKKY